MASYPGSVPALGTLSGSDYPQSAHVNTPNREVEAICGVLGTNPKNIVDSVAPSASPATIAAYLSMMGNILKSFGGLSHWYEAAVPNRMMISGHGAAGTVPAASGVRYIDVGGGSGLATTESDTYWITPFNFNIRQTGIFVQLLTAFAPGDGFLNIVLRQNAGDTAIALNIPHGSPAGIYRFNGGTGIPNQVVSFGSNQTISVKMTNFDTTNASGQIGAIGILMEQAG